MSTNNNFISPEHPVIVALRQEIRETDKKLEQLANDLDQHFGQIDTALRGIMASTAAALRSLQEQCALLEQRIAGIEGHLPTLGGLHETGDTGTTDPSTAEGSSEGGLRTVDTSGSDSK